MKTATRIISAATIPDDTRTPAEVDGRIAVLSMERLRHQAILDRVAKLTDEERTWNTRLIMLAEDAERELAEISAELAPLDALYVLHRWSRWEIVQNSNGHIHRDRNTHGLCDTCFRSTQFGWVHQASGATDVELVEAFGMDVCSVCIPDAPAMPAYKTAGWVAAAAEADAGFCQDRAVANVVRYSRGRPYGDCVCGERGVDLNQDGRLRKHRDRRVVIAEKIADPKLICGPDGNDLRIEGALGYTGTFRTVRAATIAYVDAMVWANVGRHREAYQGYATRLAEALAAKTGVDVATWTAAMEPKVVAKVRRWNR